jgi:hypothetical protein
MLLELQISSKKHQTVFENFQGQLGTCSQRKLIINFDQLGWHPQQLHHLELSFLEQEVESIIKTLPKEKSPGSDNFIRSFYRHCWEIIKPEIMGAINQFYTMSQ